MNAVMYALPVFLLLIVLELCWSRLAGKKVLRTAAAFALTTALTTALYSLMWREGVAMTAAEPATVNQHKAADREFATRVQ